MPKREAIEWCDIWVTTADRETNLRVLLLGDSITRSYFPWVEKKLPQEFACARLATAKCVCDPAYKKELSLLLDDYTFATIHFNNGLHGWEYTEEEYADGVAAGLDFIKQHAPDSRLILATSTPIWDKDETKTKELALKNQRVKLRNVAAAAHAVSRGIAVNDLYAAVIDHPEYMSPDGIHFNEEGQLVLGEQVAAAIQTA